jgi:hypothetical protein
MKTNPLPHKRELERRFRYQNGKLFYRCWVSGLARSWIGEEAGFMHHSGRRYIRIRGKEFPASRIIWTMFYGKIPRGKEIDHKDRNPSNDRISNLRIVSRALNMRNKSDYKSNSSGYRGVSLHKETGRWRPYCCVGGKMIYDGLYANIEEAAQVAARLRKKHHGKYAAHP